jgi:hypothetical protein
VRMAPSGGAGNWGARSPELIGPHARQASTAARLWEVSQILTRSSFGQEAA